MSMRTEYLRADAEAVRRAAEVIRAGGLVAFPTETVYGLGADALSAAAVTRIFEAKERPRGNPLIVHLAGIVDADSVFEMGAEFGRTWPASTPSTTWPPRCPPGFRTSRCASGPGRSPSCFPARARYPL